MLVESPFRILFVVILLLISLLNVLAREQIKFNAKDGVVITADLYLSHPKTAPFIVLFHQAGWSRGEYLEIAPKLNQLGFNCMAVDQRSGSTVNNVKNETRLSAQAKMKGTSFLDALEDMRTAIKFAKKAYAEQKMLIWGSSYSASLVFVLASEDTTSVIDGVLAFSPGEYFSKFGKGDDFISKAAANIDVKVFVTAAKNEKEGCQPIFDAITTENKTYYVPTTSGNHGSRALWEKFPDHKQYWEAIRVFLSTFLQED